MIFPTHSTMCRNLNLTLFKDLFAYLKMWQPNFTDQRSFDMNIRAANESEFHQDLLLTILKQKNMCYNINAFKVMVPRWITWDISGWQNDISRQSIINTSCCTFPPLHQHLWKQVYFNRNLLGHWHGPFPGNVIMS